MYHNRLFSSYEHELNGKQIPIKVIRRIHTADTDIVMHGHEFVELIITIKGSANHVISIPDDKNYSFKIGKGDVFLINQGESHCYYMEKDFLEIINIIFDPSIISQLSPIEGDSLKPIDFIDSLSIVPLRKKLNWMLQLTDSELEEAVSYIEHMDNELTVRSRGYRTRVIMLLSILLSLLERTFETIGGNSYKSEFSKRADITKAISFLEHNYCADIRLDFLARISCCSTRHLTRKFNELMGCSIISYIHKLRIERACYLLLNTDFKIIDIASKVGFNEISFFNRIFKSQTGLSSQKYRHINK